ncbi:MAG TPA: hypothetical protein VE958_09850 [Bryobacteraceae bacterium]|nr:hypothetical protein [Bryobacteraceae bacterium]
MDARKLIIGALAITAGISQAQTTNQRRAAIVGGGGPGQGKCTIEVVVDGSAQVEVRGDTANLRNTGGQTPQWRRFECTSAMPANPADFRFAGVDGRGRQTLVRDPRNNGGAAVVEIQDSQGGTEGYTFDLFWGNEPVGSGGFQSDRGFRNDRGFQDERGFGPPDNRPPILGSRPYRRMTEQEALDVCRRSVRDQAVDRFRTPNIDIRNVLLDDNPGRRDWIAGDVVVRGRFGRQSIYRFSCSVNFDTGQVRSTHIDQFDQGYYPYRR